MVGWKVDGDYVNFDASGKASEKERYLAVGFSSTGLMVGYYTHIIDTTTYTIHFFPNDQQGGSRILERWG